MDRNGRGRPVTRQPRPMSLPLPYTDYEDEFRRQYGRGRQGPENFGNNDDFRNYVRSHVNDKRRGPMSSPPVLRQPVMIAARPPPPPYGRRGPPSEASNGSGDEYLRDWSSGLMDCTMDQKICACVMLNPCYSCMVMEEFGESMLLPCCAGPGLLMALRAQMRERLNIEGSLLEDCGVTYCCGPCAFCQIMREKRFEEAAERGEIYPPVSSEGKTYAGGRYRDHPRGRYDDRRYDDRYHDDRRRRADFYEEDPYSRF